MANVTPVLSSRLISYAGAGPHVLDAYSQNATVVVNHGTAAAVHVPNDSVVPFPVGTQITVVQQGAGAVTVTVPGSDTLVGSANATAGAGQRAFLTKIAPTVWAVSKA